MRLETSEQTIYRYLK
ncbi:hypothetical protein LXP63_03090 [Yersinia pestis subsp. pestis]|nr:hypothetical protein [Yersinia pestis]MCD9427924.1 hypothetical protein [Yersinia pestis]MCD9450585.1 hypothetical protein [Yersinia pestis]MCF2950944.1 hypothetical protein [Yersinia pestis subsp. pestis]MCF2957073.1 hypothetical protein [Yersinia pestis subsp. pestis]MCF2958743.1 hypothetical protein [Yersinia pestis subsp. pestis]